MGGGGDFFFFFSIDSQSFTSFLRFACPRWSRSQPKFAPYQRPAGGPRDVVPNRRMAWSLLIVQGLFEIVILCTLIGFPLPRPTEAEFYLSIKKKKKYNLLIILFKRNELNFIFYVEFLMEIHLTSRQDFYVKISVDFLCKILTNSFL